MLPREIVDTIVARIEDLDFGYESENMPEDTTRAALDIAVNVGLITPQQRARIEIEDRNQRTLEQHVDRIAAQRRWDAMTPEEQRRETMLHDSMRASTELLRFSVMRMVFDTPPMYERLFSDVARNESGT